MAETRDYDHTIAFMSALAGDPDAPCTWQTFPDAPGKKGDPDLIRILHGPLSEVADELELLNDRGAGIFVTVNQTDLKGRRKGNVTGIRAAFVDKDDGELQPSPIPPGIVVQSARGQHAYWLVKPGEPLEKFSEAQEALIRGLGTDPQVKDLPRVMRLPGFLHVKGDPFLVKVVHTNGRAQHTLAEIAGQFPKAEPFKAAKEKAEGTKAIPESERNDRLFRLACSLRKKGLDEDAIAAALLAHNEKRCRPPLPAEEVEAIARSASRYSADDGWTEDGRRIVDLAAPYAIAQGFLEDLYMLDEHRGLHAHQAEFHAWDGTAFLPVEEAAVTSDMFVYLGNVVVPRTGKDKTISYEPVKPTPARVRGVVDSLRALVHLPASLVSPAWLPGFSGPPPEEIIPCRNGLAHVSAGRLLPHTPTFFNQSSLGIDYREDAPEPKEWLGFLRTLWPDDPAATARLQEMFGLLLTRDTKYQKIFFLVGPKRAGKGTIARVLARLLGENNLCAPSMASLATEFGLAPLIEKRVAIISDARLGGNADKQQTVCERLLSISGEDAMTINRKHVLPWTGRLPTRIVVMSNELPKIADASGALSSRLVILRFTNSFYGKEDLGLLEKILPEAPGILLWALEGLGRLRENEVFTRQEGSSDLMWMLADLESPVAAFVGEACQVGSSKEVACMALFAKWREWCAEQHRDYPGTAQNFARDLHSVVPGLRTIQRRVGERKDGKLPRFYVGIGLGEVA